MRILVGKCRLTITDGKRFVICHSEDPYPVWIWTADDADDAELELVYSLTRKNFGISGRTFNTKYSLAKHFIKRAAEDGCPLKIATNMLAYRCPRLAPYLKKSVSGCVERAVAGDETEVAELLREFHGEASVEIFDDETLRKKADALVKSNSFFFWRCGSERVACCSYSEMAGQCTLHSVFTKKEHRRQGYAASLVYEVTGMILGDGKEPILYTNADYAASNACYTKIGFIPQGELCTLGE